MSSEIHDTMATREFVTIMVSDQLCGIDVLKVQDVLGPQKITPVPLADAEVAGLLNLRGRIVTAIDLRGRLGLEPRSEEDGESMNVVVEHDGELYSLIVDTVGEVLRLSDSNFERNPVTLDPLWRKYSEGVYQLKEGLLVVLNGEILLEFGKKAAA